MKIAIQLFNSYDKYELEHFTQIYDKLTKDSSNRAIELHVSQYDYDNIMTSGLDPLNLSQHSDCSISSLLYRTMDHNIKRYPHLRPIPEQKPDDRSATFQQII